MALSSCDAGADISTRVEYTRADADLEARLLRFSGSTEFTMQHLIILVEGCWGTRLKLISIKLPKPDVQGLTGGVSCGFSIALSVPWTM